MHYKGEVTVRFKKSILEPQGKAIGSSLKENGHIGFGEFRVGKIIEVNLEAKDLSEAKDKLTKVSEELLYNPVMEIADIKVEEIL